MNNLIMILLGILSLSLLIIIHEFGHLIVGLMLNAKPKTFAVGFGKSLFSYNFKGIKFTLNAIPIGGFVDFNTTQFPKIEKDKDVIAYWKWIFIALAGPLFNFLTSWVILLGIMFSIISNMQVYKAPAITDKNIIKIEKLADLDKSNFQTFAFFHDNKLFLKKDNFIQMNEKALKESSFSILQTTQYSIEKASESFAFIATQYWGSIIQLFKKSEYAQLSGPIGIVNQFKNQSKSAIETLSFICLLSFAIGFFNLLPFFTILDGGRIVIALFQTILGDRQFINTLTIKLNNLSLVFFFLMFAYTTVSDFFKLF